MDDVTQRNLAIVRKSYDAYRQVIGTVSSNHSTRMSSLMNRPRYPMAANIAV